MSPFKRFRVSPEGRRLRLFSPILAGATLPERLVGCVGALLAICLTGLVCGYFVGTNAHLPLLAGPIGASAVLLFAVPASPLAQPWPIIGGNTMSAFIGIAVGQLVGDPVLATGLAVSLAIAAMSFARCLHPPGGATALTAVIGGPAVATYGYLFPLLPVAINSLLLVALGVAFHKLSRRAYPHRPATGVPNRHLTADKPSQMRVGFLPQDIDAALETEHEAFDIDRGDLDRLLRRVEQQALSRTHGHLRCADIMSRDVITIRADDTAARARELLLKHNVRMLPVTDDRGRLAGAVGLRDLPQQDRAVGSVVVPAATAAPADPAVGLVARLTDGRAHAVVVTDDEKRIVGLITQSDLLAALARALQFSGARQGDRPSLRQASRPEPVV